MSTFTDEFYQNIAIKIRFYRIKNGFTQEQLSEMISKNLKYIGHVERCERKISLTMLIKIIEIFKIKPKEFFNF